MDVCTLLSIYNYYTGKPCILCSTSVFMEGYRAQNSNGVLRPALLIAQLPKINESFGPAMQQCAAEFFLDFTRALDTTCWIQPVHSIVRRKLFHQIAILLS